MKFVKILLLLLFLTGLNYSYLFGQNLNSQPESIAMMTSVLNQFKKVHIQYDKGSLSKNQHSLLLYLVKAAQVMDEIFWKQASEDGLTLRALLKKSKTKEARFQLQLLEIMYSRFNRLDHFKPFYGKGKRSLGATFYPSDMTKAEFLNWVKAHPKDKEAFESPYTLIRRSNGVFTTIPYNLAYRDDLEQAAQYLKLAANLAENKSLKKYLLSRAKSFLTNNYYHSDIDWIEIQDSLIEPTIGPYEVYEDELFNYKAAFEAFLCLKDQRESLKLKRFSRLITELTPILPIEPRYGFAFLGSTSVISVVNLVYASGDAKKGIQTIAFNLPNDEKVRKNKGSKNVLLKNICQAKFQSILVPIAQVILDKKLLAYVSFPSYFNHVLLHELSHGFGFPVVKVQQKKSSVHIELKELYSAIEELKADVMGIYSAVELLASGKLPRTELKSYMTTYVAGMFRSVRFGIGESHGKGTIIQLNFLIEAGVIYFNRFNRIEIDYSKFKAKIRQLLQTVLKIQGNGDYQGAKNLIEKYAVLQPEVKAALDKLKAIPTDILPIYAIDKEVK